MENVNKIALFLVGGLALLLAACGGSPTQLPPNPADLADLADIDGLADLEEALRARGAAVELGESVNQPFILVPGQTIFLDGVEVQAYEFVTEGSRQEVSSTITESGEVTGVNLPEWEDIPNFWAQGRLIVLYVGRDEPTIDLLSFVLGPPITGEGLTDLPPRAVLIAREQLAAELGVPPERVAIDEIDEIEWPDACLGLAGPGEVCAQVITPGWLVLVNVDGRGYELHASATGDAVRWRELEGD